MKTDVSGFPEKRPPTGHSQSKEKFNTEHDLCVSDWQEVVLADIAFVNPSERIGKGGIAKKISMEALQPFSKKPSFYVLDKYNGGMKFRNGDTVVARITPCLENGKTAFIDLLKDDEVGFCSTEYIVLREKPEVSDKHFLYYFAVSPIFRDVAILSMTGSSGRQRVETDVVKRHLFQLPALPEQQAIARLLSSLDDKIDLLNRQNKTLEAMAETLFRQWFVEDVPIRWKPASLGDVAINVRESVKTSDLRADSKYIGLEHISRRSIALNHNGFGDAVSSNKSAFAFHDILFGKLRPYFHKVCFAPFSGICSTDILVIRPKSPEYFAFCMFAFFQNDVVEFANLGSGGTRMPRTDWGTLKSYPIQLPDTDTLDRFNRLVLPSIEKISLNLKQIKSLENLRDTLLPKLMSGEVRVAFDASIDRNLKAAQFVEG